MTVLPDRDKLQLAVRHHERIRAASDGDSKYSPRAQALKACGVSRSTEFYVKQGRSIKSPKTRKGLDEYFRAEIAAEVGSSEYRRLWTSVRALVEGNFTAPNSEYLVGAAYGHWAAIALDADRTDTERLLAGRAAEYVLYHYSRKSRLGRSTSFVFAVDADAVEERGLLVIGCLTEILARNQTPPTGLFDHGSNCAQELGYRLFRIRLFGDHAGWVSTTLKDDESRARHFAKAYQAGLAIDLMSLRDAGLSDVAHPNNAFVLATHAHDWTRAAEYGVTLIKAHPTLLTATIGGLKPLLEDRTVWPGLAAVIEKRWFELPTKIREILTNPAPEHCLAVGHIRQMVAGVRDDSSYLSTLKLGK